MDVASHNFWLSLNVLALQHDKPLLHYAWPKHSFKHTNRKKSSAPVGVEGREEMQNPQLRLPHATAHKVVAWKYILIYYSY